MQIRESKSHVIENCGDGPCSAEPWPPHNLVECSEPCHVEPHREHGNVRSVTMITTDEEYVF